jgi:hypothetical protein
LVYHRRLDRFGRLVVLLARARRWVIVAIIGLSMFGASGLFGGDWQRREEEKYLRRHSSTETGDDDSTSIPPPP